VYVSSFPYDGLERSRKLSIRPSDYYDKRPSSDCCMVARSRLPGTYPHDAQLDYVGLPVRAKLSWGYNRGNLCLSFQAHILPYEITGR